MKKIYIFSGYYLPHLGGVEKYTDNLGKKLVENNIDVTIVTSNYDNRMEEENINGMKIFRIPIYDVFKNRYPIPKKNNMYRIILKKLEKNKPDAIIVNTRFHLTSLIGAKYGHKYKIPVFLVEHGSQHLTVDNKILDFFGAIYEHLLTMYLKRYVDYSYGVSDAACVWQKHFKIISDGVWYNSINDFSKELNVKKDNNTINILYAGRILRQKGIYELLNSFQILNKKYKNVKLTIAGDGNHLEEMKKKYKNKNIKFLGKVDFNKLKELYSSTDIFVYAPIWPEGLPTSILEAGLCNCAVIASPQGGIKEIIEDGKNGLMVNNEKELTGAMEKLILDNDLRIKFGKNIKKTIESKFTWDVTSKKIIKDIEKALK